MIPVFSVAQVRAAEERAFADLPEGELMARAVRGLFGVCREVLADRRGGLYGARVVILVGAGNNGADAMWTGAQLAQRGVQVTALAATENFDRPSGAALEGAGGRVLSAELPLVGFQALVGQADIVLDGLLGIGGTGALREPAASWSQAILGAPAEIIAVDLPSGVDPDSGAVTDPAAVIQADRTVCLGSVKAGLIWGAGPDFAGEITFIDIGLGAYFDAAELAAPVARLVDLDDAIELVSEPQRHDNKYTRGVVGVVSGSSEYPGAAVLSTGGALLGGTGMVRYAGAAAPAVVAHWPEAVIAAEVDPESKTNAWVVGSGGGVDQLAQGRLNRVLAAPVPVVLDADALTLLAESDELRQRLRERHGEQLVTILTPHDGEFARLGYQASETDGIARAATLATAAYELGAVILLKGATTLVATPAGELFANDEASPWLATAGSGDVLAGLLGSMLAHNQAQQAQRTQLAAASGSSAGSLSLAAAGKIAASAALLHGLAGIVAADQQGSIVATDILDSLPSVLGANKVDQMDQDEEVR